MKTVTATLCVFALSLIGAQVLPGAHTALAAEPGQRVSLLKLTIAAGDGHPLKVEELRSFDNVEACDQFILHVGPKKPADGKIELLACAVPLTVI